MQGKGTSDQQVKICPQGRRSLAKTTERRSSENLPGESRRVSPRDVAVALAAAQEVLVPGLCARVREQFLQADVARPEASRGPVNLALAALQDVYCAGNAGFRAEGNKEVLAVLRGEGLLRVRLGEERWHLTPAGAALARQLWERPVAAPPWAQAEQVWPLPRQSAADPQGPVALPKESAADPPPRDSSRAPHYFRFHGAEVDHA